MVVSNVAVNANQSRGKFRTGLKPSLLVAILVFFIHFFIVVLLLKDRGPKPSSNSEQFIQLRLLSPEKLKPISPLIDRYLPLQLAPVVVQNLELPAITIEQIDSNPGKVGLSQQSESTVFDPRLRKKLSDIYSRGTIQPAQELKSLTDPSGVQIVEVKQGECIRAMPGDASARGDNWSLRFKCGKGEGERMVDNINADMAERSRRKHDK